MTILFVCGIHGVGKTTFCQKISEALSIPCFSSSSLIRDASQDAIPDPALRKRVQNISSNQQLLITAVQNKFCVEPRFILDGHTTILDASAQWQPITADIFATIGVTALIMLAAPPKIIQERLVKRDGKAPPLEVILQHQEAEKMQAQSIAAELRISLFITDGENLDLLPDIKNILA